MARYVCIFSSMLVVINRKVVGDCSNFGIDQRCSLGCFNGGWFVVMSSGFQGVEKCVSN